MATKTLIIYAAYNSGAKMSNGHEQGAASTNEVVEKVASMLIASGC